MSSSASDARAERMTTSHPVIETRAHTLLVAPGFHDYEVIDAGDGLKLERLGDVVISRQCAQAFWPRALSENEWKRAHATHFRTDNGPGAWTTTRKVPPAWPIRCGDLHFEMRLTEFGHIGMFAEQQAQWGDITARLAVTPESRVLNLFAYTGGSTLAAGLGKARVTHVDAVKGVVSWARGNATASGLESAPIRWIVDDAPTFVAREVRREVRYDAIILDPPTFGRAPNGAVWKIESDLVPMLANCERLLSEDPRFVLLSAHTPGVTAATLENLLGPLVERRGGRLEAGEMVHRVTASKSVIPAGVYCRWTPG